MYGQLEQKEENLPILTDEESDADVRLVVSQELSFSAFLIQVVQGIRNAFGSDHVLFKRKNISYYVQLTLTFIVLVVATSSGGVYLNKCFDERMICIFLIVQGVCGLVVVLVHISAAVIDCTSANKLYRSKLCENVIKAIFGFTHVTVVFSIIWFFIGHIWVFQSRNQCKTNVATITAMILIFEYILGIWYLFSRIWNSPSGLQWLQKAIQRRLGRISDNNLMVRRPVLEMIDSSNDEMNQIPIAEEQTNNTNNKLFVHLTSAHIICFLIGLILCGIPTTVIITLSVKSSEPTSSTTVAPPIQCFTYTTLTDSTRHHTYGGCCATDYNQAAGWYRFTGDGGTRLLTTPPSRTGMCQATYPGWWNGTLPMRVGKTTVGNICFYESSSSCARSLSPIIATNCSGYYVFYLVPTPCCDSYRYCTTS